MLTGIVSVSLFFFFVKNFTIVSFLLSHALTAYFLFFFLRAGQAVNFGTPEKYFRLPSG